MSLFPHFTNEFSPLFRMIDEYDRAAREHFRNTGPSVRTWSPKFDVKENKEGYELHGEFPGMEQKNISIEWTDGNTLTVSGKTENYREEGTRPQGFIEGEVPKKATVEDAPEEGSTQVTKKGNAEVAKKSEGTAKYWIQERSVGEFHRSFSFPTRVDQDNVKASLKNGVLSILIPKAQPAKPRKISIEG